MPDEPWFVLESGPRRAGISELHGASEPCPRLYRRVGRQPTKLDDQNHQHEQFRLPSRSTRRDGTDPRRRASRWCGSGSRARPSTRTIGVGITAGGDFGRTGRAPSSDPCPRFQDTCGSAISHAAPRAAGGETADDRRPRGGLSTRRPPTDCSSTLPHEAGARTRSRNGFGGSGGRAGFACSSRLRR